MSERNPHREELRILNQECYCLSGTYIEENILQNLSYAKIYSALGRIADFKLRITIFKRNIH